MHEGTEREVVSGDGHKFIQLGTNRTGRKA